MSKEFNLEVDLTQGSKLSKSVGVIMFLMMLAIASYYFITGEELMSYSSLVLLVTISWLIDVVRDFTTKPD